jgi:hypothetical protein
VVGRCRRLAEEVIEGLTELTIEFPVEEVEERERKIYIFRSSVACVLCFYMLAIISRMSA